MYPTAKAVPQIEKNPSRFIAHNTMNATKPGSLLSSVFKRPISKIRPSAFAILPKIFIVTVLSITGAVSYRAKLAIPVPQRTGTV